MAGKYGVKLPRTVVTAKRPSFVFGSRPPDMYTPRIGQRPSGDITKPPRIAPVQGKRSYGKQQPGGGFGNTGLTGES